MANFWMIWAKVKSCLRLSQLYFYLHMYRKCQAILMQFTEYLIKDLVFLVYLIKSCIMGQPRPPIGAINFEVSFMSLVIWHQKSFQKLLHKTAIAAAQYFDRRCITECNFWQKMKVAKAKVILNKSCSELRPSPPGTFHISIGNFLYFIIRFYDRAIK